MSRCGDREFLYDIIGACRRIEEYICKFRMTAFDVMLSRNMNMRKISR
mgnify:CR=1 FL=1